MSTRRTVRRARTRVRGDGSCRERSSPRRRRLAHAREEWFHGFVEIRIRSQRLEASCQTIAREIRFEPTSECRRELACGAQAQGSGSDGRIGCDREVSDETDYVALAGCAREDFGEHRARERMLL